MNDYITSSQWREILHHPTVSCTYILKANDGQFINEVVKCPKYCALTIWPVLLSIFIRILNWVESSVWTIRCLRPTFAVIGDFQMQWSDGQKLGTPAFSYLGCVKLVCIFLRLWQDWEYAHCVSLCLLFQAGLMVPLSTPTSTLPAFPQIFSFVILTLLLFLGQFYHPAHSHDDKDF